MLSKLFSVISLISKFISSMFIYRAGQNSANNKHAEDEIDALNEELMRQKSRPRTDDDVVRMSLEKIAKRRK